MTLLTVNAGSSSVRLTVFAADNGVLHRVAEYHDDGAAPPQSTLQAFLPATPISAVAHRVVHGGSRLTAPCRVDAGVEAEIERLASLAPLHNPRALAWIRACRALPGGACPQIAVFDTAFYSSLPAVARAYALPRDLAQRLELHRYGFHGLAHEVMWQRWCELHPERRAKGRVISLQLGAGCSITATADGRPLDTSMGFSPLEGLVMATRCGDLDPGVMIHLLRYGGMTAETLDKLLNRQSGLAGLAGNSDMHALLGSDDPAARLAVEIYCYRARKYLGAYLAVLGGTDAILFGGGVGEHAPEVRAKILQGMEWAGLSLDSGRNRAATGREARIDAATGPTEIRVVPVDEAVILAQEAAKVLAGANRKEI